MNREVLEFEMDGENETVHGKTENSTPDCKNENDPSTKINTKRTWTPARELAWAKCQKGREEYMKTRKEITEKEQENIRMKEKIKLEMLKKKIRQEIEDEMKSEMKQNEVEDGEIEEKKVEKTEPVKKKAKKEESESEESSSEEEIIEKKRKKHKSKKSKKVISDESEQSESDNETKIKKKRSSSVANSRNPTTYVSQPRPSLSRFSFV